MNIDTCPKCTELADALNRNLERAHRGDSGASMAVTKVAAAIRFHRTRCALCVSNAVKSEDQNTARTRAA